MKIKKPYPYQKPLINAVYKELKKSDRCTFPPACGTGKTLMSWFVANKLKANKIIVVAPTLNLVSQTLKTWVGEMQATGMKYKVIVLGSDKTITRNTDAQTTTDQEVLNTFLEENEKVLIVSTYNSNYLLSQTGKEFDLCIYDEAHETAGKIGKMANTLIYDNGLTINKRLFLTATPKTVNVRKSNVEVLSMDNESIYGKIVGRYSTRKAINDGNLTDYKVLLIDTKSKKNKNLENKIKGLFDEDVFKSEDIILAYTLLNEIKTKKLNKLLCFHSTNKKANLFSKLMHLVFSKFQKAIDYKVFYLDYHSSQKKKEEVLEQFEKCEYGILCNSQLFYQGYDLPMLNGVVFGDKMGSSIRIVQTLGRALRKSEGKDFGYVILPLQDIKKAEGKGFYNVVRVLSALANEDDNLKYELKALAKDGERKQGKPSMIEWDEKFVFTDQIKKELRDTYVRTWNYGVKVDFVSHEEFVVWCKENGVKTQRHFNTLEKPKNIPSNPYKIYIDFLWKNITGNLSVIKYLSKKEFKAWCKKRKVKSYKHFLSLEREVGVPSCPHVVYKDFTWEGITGNVRKKEYVQYKDFKSWCKINKVTSYRVFSSLKKPKGIPSLPKNVYKDFSWADITGNPTRKDFVSYAKFKAWCKKNKVISYKYFQKIDKPIGITQNPRRIYKNFSWVDITGNKSKVKRSRASTKN